MATNRELVVPWKSRRILGVVSLVTAVSVLVALLFVPAQVSAHAVQVSAGGSAVVDITVPRPGWVTVHFDMAGDYGGMAPGAGMHYWMDGPSSGMFDHSMMRGGDSHSFWSWGGVYHCGVGYSAESGGPVSVWVNASWGLL